jgi:hypothetical protein
MLNMAVFHCVTSLKVAQDCAQKTAVIMCEI